MKKVYMVLFIFLSFKAFSQTNNIHEGFIYEIIDDRSVTITKYLGNESNVVIPSVINSLPVTAIGYSVFSWNKNLENITIPSTVTVIGDEAFYNCENLSNIIIPSSVRLIGEMAFYFCESITTVNIPSSVITIRDAAFSFCRDLININVDSRNPNYRSIDGVLFDKNIRYLISYPAGRLIEEYRIPDSVINIGRAAFAGSIMLKNIIIPQSVNTINKLAFISCGLINVNIPSSVNSIGELLFAENKYLKNISIPASVVNINEDAFNFCYSILNFNVDQRNLAYLSIDGVLFDKSGNILIKYPVGREGVYTIPSSVTTIGNRAFLGCYYKLTSINIPSSVTKIEWSAFAGCNRLTSVVIPSSVTSIENRAFAGCDRLTSVTLSRRTMVAGNAFDENVRIQYKD